MNIRHIGTEFVCPGSVPGTPAGWTHEFRSDVPDVHTVSELSLIHISIFGGFMGSVVMLGIKRGLFSNEAGVGASATAAGSAGVSHPVKQGLVQVLSVFIDTVVICSATAFLLLCSGVAPSADMAGMAYVQAAMNNVFGTAGVVFITVALILFAFTTLLGNYYFAETGMAYLCGKTPVKGVRITQRVIAIVIVLIGSVASLGIVWDTAEMCIRDR